MNKEILLEQVTVCQNELNRLNEFIRKLTDTKFPKFYREGSTFIRLDNESDYGYWISSPDVDKSTLVNYAYLKQNLKQNTEWKEVSREEAIKARCNVNMGLSVKQLPKKLNNAIIKTVYAPQFPLNIGERLLKVVNKTYYVVDVNGYVRQYKLTKNVFVNTN